MILKKREYSDKSTGSKRLEYHSKGYQKGTLNDPWCRREYIKYLKIAFNPLSSLSVFYFLSFYIYFRHPSLIPDNERNEIIMFHYNGQGWMMENIKCQKIYLLQLMEDLKTFSIAIFHKKFHKLFVLQI